MNRRTPVSGARLFGHEQTRSGHEQTLPGRGPGDRRYEQRWIPSSQPQGRTLEAHKPTETNQQTFARFPPGPCWTLPEPPVSPMISFFLWEKRESDAAIREAQAPSGRGGARALMHTHTHTPHQPGVRSFRYPLAGTTGHKNRTIPRCD